MRERERLRERERERERERGKGGLWETKEVKDSGEKSVKDLRYEEEDCHIITKRIVIIIIVIIISII